MDRMAQRLAGRTTFIRSRRSGIVNVRAIATLERYDKGTYYGTTSKRNEDHLESILPARAAAIVATRLIGSDSREPDVIRIAFISNPWAAPALGRSSRGDHGISRAARSLVDADSLGQRHSCGLGTTIWERSTRESPLSPSWTRNISEGQQFGSRDP
jgi:hypothetical protein